MRREENHRKLMPIKPAIAFGGNRMAENKKPRITAIFIALVGLPMVWRGAELAMLGGTPYYLLASIMMILSAWWLFNGNKLGFLTYAGFNF